MRKIFNKIVTLMAAGFMLVACEKNTFPEVAEHFDIKSGANIKFFFHVDGAPRANFYLNDKKVTGVAPTSSGVELGNLFGSAFPSNAYAVVPAGSFTLSAIDTATTKKGGVAEVLATKQVSLEKGKNYSAYLVGTKTAYEVFTVEDKLPPADNVSIYWRFINTMANMPFNVDVYAVRAAVPATPTSPAEPAVAIELGKNIGFKGLTQYIRLEPGSYAFKVYPTNTTYDPFTTKAYLQSSVVLGSLGRVYTTQIRGEYAATPKTTYIDFWRDR
jgi:hypothetical protein